MKINKKYIIGSALFLTLAAGGATLAYQAGKRQGERQSAELQDEVDRLKAGEKDAAVVKRVSQQMEDIAYQQKSISDEQRDRAEEQSQLAILNASRAEQESRLAREAEGKALASADEAKRERSNAEQQQRIAVEQRDQATHQKSVSDTLNVRTQARILGVSSQVRREAGDTEVADLLAYTSWYFLKHYKGNQYFSDSFKALTQATGGMGSHKMKQGGSVNAIAAVPGTPRQCVAVTTYGEVEWLTATVNGTTSKRISSKVLLNNKAYDFRDVVATKTNIYALSQKGPLCVLDYTGRVATHPLPADSYIKAIAVGSRILLAGQMSFCWYENGHVSAPVYLQKKLSTVVNREGVISLFFADGSYAELDKNDQVQTKTPLEKSVVTAAHYDAETKCLSLGVKEGTVYPLNPWNRRIELLAAHKSRCMDIAMQGSTIVTGGYDKNIFLWHMDNLMFESGLNFRQEMKAKTAAKGYVRSKNEIPTEWLVPVDYKFDGWTLSVCGDMDKKSVWVGTSAGTVMFLNTSADDMAAQLHAKLKRPMTEQEWTRFVGVSIPYMKLK